MVRGEAREEVHNFFLPTCDGHAWNCSEESANGKRIFSGTTLVTLLTSTLGLGAGHSRNGPKIRKISAWVIAGRWSQG